jgi:hypothetical protein
VVGQRECRVPQLGRRRRQLHRRRGPVEEGEGRVGVQLYIWDPRRPSGPLPVPATADGAAEDDSIAPVSQHQLVVVTPQRPSASTSDPRPATPRSPPRPRRPRPPPVFPPRPVSTSTRRGMYIRRKPGRHRSAVGVRIARRSGKARGGVERQDLEQRVGALSGTDLADRRVEVVSTALLAAQ